MFRVLTCITQEHTLWLVGVAAVICLASNYSAFRLLHRSERTSDLSGLAWRLASAFAIGAGIWSTHFVAMLAYDPGVVIGYEIRLTILSFFVAMAVGFCGLQIIRGSTSFPVLLGGSLILGL